MPHPDSKQSEMRISALYCYPVKSCSGISLEEARLDDRGIKDDRGWVIVDPDGRFLTQRQLPAMSLIKPEIVSENDDRRQLRLSAPGMEPILTPELVSPEAICTGGDDRAGTELTVTVWKDECPGIHQGNQAAGWLSRYLGRECALVRMSDNAERQVRHHSGARKTALVGFADGYPLLLISSGSLTDLNERLAAPVSMNRFRPNIVIDGCPPFAEDGWQRIKTGNVIISLVEACARCAITTVDQETGRRGREPLTTLAQFRQEGIDNKILFGQNAIHKANGTLAVGSAVEVIK